MTMTRRQFLGAAAAGTAAVGAGAYALADGPDYAVQGLDVSKWQGNVNWGQVVGAGKKFCFCKATEGTPNGAFTGGRGPLDPNFATNWPAIKQAGLIRAPYHMVRPSMGTPKAQADYFLDTVQPVSGDLRPALDMELNDGLTPAQVWQFLQLMVSRIKARLGRAPIIYTGFFYWKDSVGNPLSNLDCPLWLARWGATTDGFIPRSWSTWTFWQYSSTGSINGISGNVDLDTFNGTLTDLNKYRLP